MNVYASVGTSWLDLIDLSILALCITYWWLSWGKN
jgi:hypothetical protein